RGVLARRGLPPRFLQEVAVALSELPRRLRPRRPREAAVGLCCGARALTTTTTRNEQHERCCCNVSGRARGARAPLALDRRRRERDAVAARAIAFALA